MTTDIEKLIAEQRGAIEKDLADAIQERDRANRKVAALRVKLDAAPRLHVKRTRKARVESLVEDSGYSRADAKAIVDADMDVP